MDIKHVMLDLETMGNTSNSAIVSIGAVGFDLETGETSHEFYRTIDLQSCLDVGLHCDASTVMWWMKQSDEARKKLTVDTKPLAEVMKAFSDWMKVQAAPKVNVWGNSNRFDCGLVKNACDAVGIGLPWLHWNERDVRTIVSLKPEVKKNMVFEGVAHDPIDDCKHQIKYVCQTLRELGL